MGAPATKRQKQVATAILADGGSNAQAARAAGVSKRSVERWGQQARAEERTEIEPGAPQPPEAVLRSLLYSPVERIRLDAARELMRLGREDTGQPEWREVEVVEDLPAGAEPYSVLVVHRAVHSP